VDLNPNAAKTSVPNAERYRHIPTVEIINLSDQRLSQRKIGKLLGMGACAVGNRLRKEGKVWQPPRVTKSQLKEARLDPAYEARPGIRHLIVPTDRIVCRECGQLLAEINANGEHSHLRTHDNMPVDEYKSKWPGARLTSFARSADQNRRQGRGKTIQELMDEFAARYLTPEERKEYDRDPEYEEHHGIKEFVACRLCGMKSKTDLHNHLKTQHDLTSAGYRAQFPKCLQLPLGLYDAKNEHAKTYGRNKSKWARKGKIVDEVPDEKLEKLVKFEHTRGPGRLAAARLKLMACLKAEDPKLSVTGYEMTNHLNPGSPRTLDARRTSLSQFFKRAKTEPSQVEMRRIEALPKVQRDDIAAEARLVIQNERRSRKPRKPRLFH
jgi:predicted transcriptional regulator